MKLPKLTLSRFDGDPTQWETFWDSFQSTIDGNTELSNIDKLKYLQNSLIGEAAQTIAGLQIKSENYSEATELLEKRYGNKQIILSRHIEDLMNSPKISANEDLRGIRALYDKVVSTTRNLKSMGVKSNSYSTVLSPIIMSKLPQELHLLISRKLDEKWDIKGLLEQLGEEVSLRERCALASIGNTNHRSVKDMRGNRIPQSFQRTQPTTSTLVAESYQHQQHIPNCLFCQKQTLFCKLPHCNRPVRKEKDFTRHEKVLRLFKKWSPQSRLYIKI